MKSLAFLLMGFVFAGCMNMYAPQGQSQPMSSVNRLATNQVLFVHHYGERQAAAERLRITPSHTSWVDASTGNYITIPTSEVINIKVRETQARKSGGFGMGMLAGASMGVMLGLSGDASASDKSTIAVLGGIGMGMLGGMVGQMTGSRETARYRVIWSNPEVTMRASVDQPRAAW